MATAFAALVSLQNNLRLIQNHPRHSFSSEDEQIESLLNCVCFLIQFMKCFDGSHGAAAEAAEAFSRRIARAAHAAEDVIESHVVDQIRAGSTLAGKTTPRFLLDLQKVIGDMDSVISKLAIVIRRWPDDLEAEDPKFSTAAAAAATSSTPLAYEKNRMVGFDDELLHLVDLLTGVPSSLRVIPIVGMGGIGFVPRPQLSEVESKQVEAAYAIEDRSWVAVSRDRRVCTMGKFNVKDDRNRHKAAARLKEKDAEKGGGSTSKRKEPEVEQPKKPKQSKKPRIEPSKEKPNSGSAIVGLPAGDDAAVEPPSKSSSAPLRVKEFLGEVSKVFSKSSFDESTSSDTNRAKFQLSFNRIISGLYAQFEVVSSLDLIEGPLKEKIAALEHRLKEAEANFVTANRALEEKEVSVSKLREALTRTEDANQAISVELEEERERFEVEAKRFCDQILELQGLVAGQCEEIQKLKVGEGLDLEAFIDSEAFTGIKDSIEDATGDELISRIKEVYPDLDLGFLTASEPSSLPAPDVEQEVEPKSVDEGGSA